MIEQLTNYILECIHDEQVEITFHEGWYSVQTLIWCPDIYHMQSIKEMGLIYHGEAGGLYIFRELS